MFVFETVIVAFSMFSAIPMPGILWNDQNMKYSLCAFPLIGAVIALLMAGAGIVMDLQGFPPLVRGAVFCLIPFAVTGGIHLDGFADTADAQASHQDREKKLQILKDSHIGAFAVMWLCMYFILSFSLWTSLQAFDLWIFLPLFMVSRSLSGLAVTCFPMAKGTGLAHTFSSKAAKGKARFLLAVLSLLLLGIMAFRSLPGLLAALSGLFFFVYYYIFAMRNYGGITGDLAGWFLTWEELIMLAVCVLSQTLLP